MIVALRISFSPLFSVYLCAILSANIPRGVHLGLTQPSSSYLGAEIPIGLLGNANQKPNFPPTAELFTHVLFGLVIQNTLAAESEGMI